MNAFKKILITVLFSLVTVGVYAQSDDYNYPQYVFKSKIPTGYRGMVEVGNGVAFELDSFSQTVAYFSQKFTTTQGFQFNRYFYLGGMIGLDNKSPESENSALTFVMAADARTYFLQDKKCSPFVGMQFGTEIMGSMYLYYTISAGCRMALTDCLGVNMSFQAGLREVLFKVGFEF